MNYDKQNRKLEALQNEIAILRAEKNKVCADANKTREVLNSTLHEIRRFSAQMSKLSERLSRELEGTQNLQQTAVTLHCTANMVSSRLAYTDIELNPRALENQIRIRAGVYKKFDKCKRILIDDARARGVDIQLVGESRKEIDTLPVFELLPFVLLDNGIKYSPRNQTVSVQFESLGGRTCVTVVSPGPFVEPSELPILFDKYVRAVEAKSMPGEGLGLFLAKQVCYYHGIEIRAESGPEIKYLISGKRYAEFRVILQFP